MRPIYEDSMKSAGLAHLDLNLLPSVLPGKGQALFVCCLTSRSRIFRSIILRRHHWRRRAAKIKLWALSIYIASPATSPESAF